MDNHSPRLAYTEAVLEEGDRYRHWKYASGEGFVSGIFDLGSPLSFLNSMVQVF